MKVVSLLLLLVFLSPAAEKTGENWMNPSIGFTGDILTDISDVEGKWEKATSQGINIRSGELIIGASIDPYAKLTANINFTMHGVELHELYSWFPYLPANMSLKAGWKLANFGRWNRFHTHAMPFTAEPRLYQEYFGGHFSGIGAELSVLIPTPFFLEATVSLYDGIHGHTHDTDPSRFDDPLEQRAAELGYSKHGSHWHSSDGSIISAEDLQDPLEPTTEVTNKEISAFPVAARIASSLEMGSDWSADFGVSGVYQKKHKYSNRIEGRSYSKAVIGSDLTLFWHPLQKNKYRNMDFGVEWLLNYEENESVSESLIAQENTWRSGLFGYLHYRHNQRFHFGGYGELFETQELESSTKRRLGVFTTFEISHYQYLRLEGSVTESPNLPNLHRLTLQYDVSIGFHSHGTQR